jgi:putative membrane protein (TIGR04086 family)
VSQRALPPIRWGAITVGAMAGVVFALLAFILLGISGIVTRTRGEIFLLFLQFLSLVVAGYVAGRLSESAEVHGGLAGLLAALVIGIISLTSTDASLTGIVALTVVAAVLGSAGGVLARWQKGQTQA